MPQAKKTVLVVEDDALISEALGEGLRRSGINVVFATDGEAGLEAALDQHPNLIILDLMMPKMNGHEMLEKLRQDKWGATVPVTVLTNAADTLDVFLVTRQPYTNYAIKSSMKLEDIVKIVKHRINNPA